jgi:hypothetical protein
MGFSREAPKSTTPPTGCQIEKSGVRKLEDHTPSLGITEMVMGNTDQERVVAALYNRGFRQSENSANPAYLLISGTGLQKVRNRTRIASAWVHSSPGL